MKSKKKPDKFFGQVAVEKGFITQDQLNEALNIQYEEDRTKKRHRPIGRILVNEGIMTLKQVGDVLKSTESYFGGEIEKSFGDVAIEKGFINSEQLEDALKKQVEEIISSGKRVSIGRILLNEGHITLQQLGVVLRTQG